MDWLSGGANASDSRGPLFETSQRQILLSINFNESLSKDECKEKEAGNVPFLKMFNH